MSASINDKITDVRNTARPNSARVSTARNVGATNLACDNLTGWPTASKVHFVTYQIDSNNNPIPATQIDCSGIVSASTITQLEVIDGTDAGNSIGDVVEMLPTAAWGQDLADALMEEHNRDGGHSDVHADSLDADSLGATLLGLIYPVGSIYTNAAVSTNPATLLGFGTWVAFGAGKVPVGVDSGDSDFDTVGETGGAKTHTLTAAQMPVHALSFSHHGDEGGSLLRSLGVTGGTLSYLAYHSNTYRASSGSTAGADSFQSPTWTFGSGSAHNNLQPYVTVYMWKRTA